MRHAPQPLESEPDDETLDGLYRRHAAWLKAGLERRFGRGVSVSADDLVQETYIRAAQARLEGPIRSPRALLMRIATHLALDQLRAVRRRGETPAAETAQQIGGPADQDAALLLKQLVLALPPKLRDVFVMSRAGGLTYEEIAERAGVSVKTVEWRMSKALALLAAHLRR